MQRLDKLFVAVLNGMLVRAELPPVPRGETPGAPATLAVIHAYANVVDSAILMTLTALDRVDKVFKAAEHITTKEETHEAQESR